MRVGEERPAVGERGFCEWVNEFCRRYTTASGWTVRFVTTQPSAPAAVVRDVRADSRSVGRVELLLPADADEAAREQARATTELLVRVIEELIATRQSARVRSEQLTTLAELGSGGLGLSDVNRAVVRLLRGGGELAGSAGLCFLLLDPETRVLSLRARYPGGLVTGLEASLEGGRVLASTAIDLQALESGPVRVDRGAANDDRFTMPRGFNAAVCLPVVGADGPLGTLWAFDRRVGGPGDREVLVLQSVANQVAALLERVALEADQATQDRVVRELEGLSETNPGEQLGILTPDAGFDAVGRCRSCDELGGDLCELVPLGAGRTLVAVGDACGHSLQSAFVMTAVRSALRVVIDESADKEMTTAAMTARINRALCHVTAGHQFMSCLIGVIDSAAMCFDYTNAGHPVPILFRQDDARSLESHGMPLGIVPETEYATERVPLRGDDLLVIFSDGLVEAVNDDFELFRSEGIVRALREADVTDDLEQVLDRIWQASDDHSDGVPRDDRTLLVIKMHRSRGARQPHHVATRESDRAASQSDRRPLPG